MNDSWQLAQLNVAHLLEPLDSPRLAGFVDNLDRVNALAESADGFVWRLLTPAGETNGVGQPFADDLIVNLSVWRDVDSLHAFVYRTAHAPIMSRRKEWFHRMSEAWAVLWWVPGGHEPTEQEAADRLARLRASGPTAEAFTFRERWPAPDTGHAPVAEVARGSRPG